MERLREEVEYLREENDRMAREIEESEVRAQHHLTHLTQQNQSLSL
jgi:hypothetical protein